MMYSSEIVTLNVGGMIYTTSVNALTTDPDSMLGVMFGKDFPSQTDGDGRHFIDADGSLFKYVLNFLRRNRLALPTDFDQYEALLAEAEFFQIQPMIEEIRRVTNSHVVTLNVGGVTYDVSEDLLEKYPTSNLYRIVRSSQQTDRNGTCFIDADGQMFQYILNFLRR